MPLASENWLGLSRSHIVKVDDLHGLEATTLAAFQRMQKAAAQQGLDLQIASSFRDFHRQLEIWQAKWQGKRPLLSLQGNTIPIETLSDIEKIHAIMTWSALPGASRHHWGTDLDVYDRQGCELEGHTLELVPQEYQPGGPCYKLSVWLDQHAQEFGFYRPYQVYHQGVAPEPWHLSYQPVARQLIAQLDIQLLARTLDASNIGGKEAILAHLPELFQRYTLNGERL